MNLPSFIVVDTSGSGYVYAKTAEDVFFTYHSAMQFAETRNNEQKTGSHFVLPVLGPIN